MGDHYPNGLLYVLKEDFQRIQQKARENFALTPPQPYKEVQPWVILANVGDSAKIRLIYGGIKETHVFHLHGHQWREQPDDPLTRIISVQGAISVSGVYNIEPLHGASQNPGDYLYRSGSLKWDVKSGMWGILRVMSRSFSTALKRFAARLYNGGKKSGTRNK